MIVWGSSWLFDSFRNENWVKKLHTPWGPSNGLRSPCSPRANNITMSAAPLSTWVNVSPEGFDQYYTCNKQNKSQLKKRKKIWWEEKQFFVLIDSEFVRVGPTEKAFPMISSTAFLLRVLEYWPILNVRSNLSHLLPVYTEGGGARLVIGLENRRTVYCLMVQGKRTYCEYCHSSFGKYLTNIRSTL